MRRIYSSISGVAGLPFGATTDLLYRWATLRLRRRPAKMIALIIGLGVLCWLLQWAGLKWVEPRLRLWMLPYRGSWIQGTMLRSLSAYFSSLNLLSCLSILIMSATLRHLIRDGHMEMLTLAPARFRPSALFYGLTSRYMPLTLIVLLIQFLDPNTSPFQRPPFHFPNQPVPASFVPLAFSALHLMAISLFCPANLFMDLALAYWLMVRFRPSYVVTAIGVIVIGVITPLVLVASYDIIDQEVARRASLGGGALAEMVRGPVVPFPEPKNYQVFERTYTYAVLDIQAFSHYAITAIGSIALGLLALVNLDAMWKRRQDSTTEDPVLIRVG